MKIRKLRETPAMKKRGMKLVEYITSRYGSLHAFKLLKYFLEHKIARDNEGFATYEIALHIAPSQVLTRCNLIRIECRADDAEQKDAETGLDLLIQKGILTVDPETDILELNVPLDSIANLHLKETDSGFEVVSDRSSADVILLPANKTVILSHRKDDGKQPNISAVPDMLVKNESGEFSLVENKFGKSTSPKIHTLIIGKDNG